MSFFRASSAPARPRSRRFVRSRPLIVVACALALAIASTPAEAQSVPFGTPTVTFNGQTISVLSGTDTLCEGVTVTLSVDGVVVASTVSDAKADFAFTIGLAPYGPGLHDLTMTYYRATTYLGYLASTGFPSSFTITPTVPTISAAPGIAGEVGATVPLIAQFGVGGVSGALDVAGQTLTFYVNDAFVGTAQTDVNGVAVLGYQLPADGGTSLYYYASFAGNGGYSASTSNYATIAVSAAATSLTAPSGSGPIGGDAALTTVLTNDTDGGPVSGVTVNFYVSGEIVGSGTMDDTGTATFDYYVTEGVGSYTLNAVSVGNLDYGSATSGAGSLTVNQAPTMLVTPVKNDAYATTAVTLTATLARTTDGQDLLGQIADFYVNGVRVGSGLTDINGVASFTYAPKLPEGTYRIQSHFSGDVNYMASVSNLGSLVISIPPWDLPSKIHNAPGPLLPR